MSYFTATHKVLVRRELLYFLNLLMSPSSFLFSTLFVKEQRLRTSRFIPQKSFKFKINAPQNFPSHSLPLFADLIIIKNEAESERGLKDGLIEEIYCECSAL